MTEEGVFKDTKIVIVAHGIELEVVNAFAEAHIESNNEEIGLILLSDHEALKVGHIGMIGAGIISHPRAHTAHQVLTPSIAFSVAQLLQDKTEEMEAEINFVLAPAITHDGSSLIDEIHATNRKQSQQGKQKMYLSRQKLQKSDSKKSFKIRKPQSK